MSLSFETDLVADDSAAPSASGSFLRILGTIFTVFTIIVLLLRVIAGPSLETHGPPPQINKGWLAVNFCSFVVLFTALPVVLCQVLRAVTEKYLRNGHYNRARLILEWLVVLNYFGAASVPTQMRTRLLLAGCYLQLGKVPDAVLALRCARHHRRAFLNNVSVTASRYKMNGLLEASLSKADDMLAGLTAIGQLETAALLIELGHVSQARPLCVDATSDLQHYRSLLVRNATIEEIRAPKTDLPRWMLVAETVDTASKINCIDKAIRDLSVLL